MGFSIAYETLDVLCGSFDTEHNHLGLLPHSKSKSFHYKNTYTNTQSKMNNEALGTL